MTARFAMIAVATIAACTMLFAGLGAVIGWALGRFTPGYYRSVFRGGDEPWFDPVSVGVGQGLTQGLAGGVAVGLAVAAILAWREVQLGRQETANAKAKSDADT